MSIPWGTLAKIVIVILALQWLGIVDVPSMLPKLGTK